MCRAANPETLVRFQSVLQILNVIGIVKRSGAVVFFVEILYHRSI